MGQFGTNLRAIYFNYLLVVEHRLFKIAATKGLYLVKRNNQFFTYFDFNNMFVYVKSARPFGYMMRYN